jgi:transcriptional regulator with XRE-family HTH domain
MTQEQAGGVVLEFGIADRLRKAREHIGAGSAEFAELTGISRGTIAHYESPEWRTRKGYIVAQWAMATGVSVEWLQNGTGEAAPTPGPGKSAPDLARLTAAKRSRARGGDATRAYPEAA